MPFMIEENRRLIETYYNELWNNWNFALADQLISPAVKFHGSVGVAVTGLDQFLAYMNLIRSAFPDFHNTIEETVAENDRVAARLSYQGTHRGVIFGVAPTGKIIRYDGLALFQLASGKIVQGHVLGNVIDLLSQLGIALAPK